MGLLGDVYSYGDTLKRKVGGLLSDPRGTLEQFVGQLGDDMNTNISNMKTGYGFGGNKSVLSDPAQVQAAQRALADYGAQSGMAAATVWHGSPHKFDKFDSSKIGTGEGAQAYGHGLYLAENEAVSKGYMRAGETAAPIQFNGEGIMNWALGNRDKVAAMPKVTQQSLAFARDFSSIDEAARMARMNDMPSVEGELRRLAAGGLLKDSPPGNLYKVDLPDEHIAKMLDWDKPLSQQAPEVQAALAATKNKQLRAVVDYASSPYSTPGLEGEVKTMGEAIKLLGMNASPAKGSAMLAKQGIPGIRYLDGGSRGAGQGSSNFVVFPGNEGLLSILERNNKALDIFKDTTWEPPLFPDTTR